MRSEQLTVDQEVTGMITMEQAAGILTMEQVAVIPTMIKAKAISEKSADGGGSDSRAAQTRNEFSTNTFFIH